MKVKFVGMKQYFRYDSFEDMYCCRRCNCFFYPADIWEDANPDAGYKKL